MMTDLTYLSFVQQHYINFSNQSTWWENPIFLAPFGGLVNSGELDPPIPGDVDPPQEVLEEQ
jgi:hypothetical protein